MSKFTQINRFLQGISDDIEEGKLSVDACRSIVNMHMREEHGLLSLSNINGDLELDTSQMNNDYLLHSSHEITFRYNLVNAPPTDGVIIFSRNGEKGQIHILDAETNEVFLVFDDEKEPLYNAHPEQRSYLNFGNDIDLFVSQSRSIRYV